MSNKIDKIQLPKIDMDDESDDEKSVKIQQNNNAEIEDNKNINDNGWNKTTKILLKKIGEKSMGYRYMHDKDSTYYSKFDYWLGIIEIILSTFLFSLSSGSLIGILADTGLRENLIASVIVTSLNIILTLLMGLITGFRTFGNYPEKSSKHRTASNNFHEIYHSIQEQFSFDISDRDHAVGFLKSKVKEFDFTMGSAPDIRKRSRNMYIKATKSNDIYKPLITGGFEAIDIGNDNTNKALDIAVENTTEGKNIDFESNYEIARFFNNF